MRTRSPQILLRYAAFHYRAAVNPHPHTLTLISASAIVTSTIASTGVSYVSSVQIDARRLLDEGGWEVGDRGGTSKQV